jgi:hypothetical protein
MRISSKKKKEKMKEKRMEDMIHEALESGQSITQANGHDQKLIVALMSSKCSIRNVFLVHTYLVVAITKIKFSKELYTTQFIQEVINDRNEKFVFNGEFVEGAKFVTHAPITFFLKDHDHSRRVGAHTRMDNTCVEKFLNNFLIFIFLGKWIRIGTDIGRKDAGDKGNGMIMNTMGRRESLGSEKNNLMFREDGLEVLRHRGCLSGLNGMELCNNARMTFFEHIFHAMGTYDLRGTNSDALELILLALLVGLHG